MHQLELITDLLGTPSAEVIAKASCHSRGLTTFSHEGGCLEWLQPSEPKIVNIWPRGIFVLCFVPIIANAIWGNAVLLGASS